MIHSLDKFLNSLDEARVIRYRHLANPQDRETRDAYLKALGDLHLAFAEYLGGVRSPVGQRGNTPGVATPTAYRARNDVPHNEGDVRGVLDPMPPPFSPPSAP